MRKNISNLHLEVLDKKRQDLLARLASHIGNFTLGGGTALSIQLAHRKSFDFDFFSRGPIKRNFAEELSRKLKIASIAVDNADELTFFTEGGIKLTFLYYPFEHLYALKKLLDTLAMFSVKDIAIQKAYTIGRRGEYRDYFDLYAVFKDGHMELPQVIADARKIYGSVFEEKIFLEQLVYFGDMLNFDIVPAGKAVPPHSEVKRFLEEQVKNYLKKCL